MLGFAITLLSIGLMEPQAQQAEARHWSNGQLAWARMPLPDFPDREAGTVQAEVTCTVAAAGRVEDCQILRTAPDGTRFGREVIQSMRRARLVEGRASAGDTMSFVLWACDSASEVERCQKIDWPATEQ